MGDVSMGSWRPTRPVVRWAVCVVVAALVLGTGVPALYDWWQQREARCAEGVTRLGPLDECVGVSDGVGEPDFAFDQHLADIQRRIGKENRRVVDDAEGGNGGESESAGTGGAGRSYVTIAYMTSLTVQSDDSNSEGAVRRQLQGAYLAQYRANRGDQPGSQKIRLLVANTGSGAAHWEHTVDQLIEMSTAGKRQDRVLAVAGLGPSTDRNRAAMRKLSEHGIAMVASTMTATNLTGIPGLVRVAPTNRDEARAASAFLKRHDFRSAVIVQDEAEANLYAQTLAEEFRKVYPDKKHHLPEENAGYDASRPDSWEGELYWITRTLCDEKPDVVYFAGRGKHLMTFINSLANRTCQWRDFTVMTGDDTTNLTPSQLRAAAAKGIDVYYTGLAHPDMWRDHPDAVSAPSAEYFQEGGWMSKTFPSDPRDDAQALMAHDATLTCVRAVRMAAHEGSTLTGAATARMFRQMRGRNQQVEGASGFLAFRNNGDPLNKAVPILKLERDGHFTLDDVVLGDHAR
ncbi:ABC transporter substrate-binding protein [Streptomyces zingiberis]|uniref:Branched-chain amino acid ABC transporter substrate-binding protein n=1 Tax=Streptomyces zingiberis TaxID=2053010 RepID=A0ABX1C5S0_9ACTN|nr:branched-chain amino acid ABC transporter substrate-binding protein [Streptomyces zingiberis]NJQ03928.1 branched-chain amino acid ABC transporter substrate-binding protein [Streptomyces zingiberis]